LSRECALLACFLGPLSGQHRLLSTAEGAEAAEDAAANVAPAALHHEGTKATKVSLRLRHSDDTCNNRELLLVNSTPVPFDAHNLCCCTSCPSWASCLRLAGRAPGRQL